MARNRGSIEKLGFRARKIMGPLHGPRLRVLTSRLKTGERISKKNQSS